MKKNALFIIGLLTLASCSKKNEFPASSTNATVTFEFPNGRTLTVKDFSVKGGAAGYTFDNLNYGGNYPIDYIVNETASPSFYSYSFNGYTTGGLYHLNFATPPQTPVTDYNEVLSQSVTLSSITANNFRFNFADTGFSPSSLQVSVSGYPSGSFSITFNVDSVSVSSGKIAYPSPGPMTIKGSFNNVSFAN